MSDMHASDIDRRPVAVIGAGTLGARIALMFAAGGSDVHIVNRSRDRALEAKDFVDRRSDAVRADLALSADACGEVSVTASLEEGIPGAWLVIESVAEDLELKRRVFGDLDRLADPDAVLATNSSSYVSSELVSAVRDASRLLNLHFLMPPQITVVELMSCGHTDPAVMGSLADRLPSFGLQPVQVGRESVGLIFNRVWAAVKREVLMVLEEGVTTPEEFDRVWIATIGQPPGPCRLMDQVGLDVVLAIEEHYAEIRPGLSEAPRRLLRAYVDRGALGVKTGRGLYEDYGG